jgi:endonuclease-3
MSLLLRHSHKHRIGFVTAQDFAKSPHHQIAITMRTSRMSRDTSRILAASRTQRTLRQTRSGATANARDAKSKYIESEESDSGLSSAPSDPESDGEVDVGNRKRKRESAASPVQVKHESKEVLLTAIESPKKESKPKKARRVPAKKVTTADGGVKVEPPPNWEEIYTLTREMRNENVAPVDTMGCESLADRNRSPRDQRFQTLVSLMLSSQTKDTVTAVAIRGMQERMPGVGWRLTSSLGSAKFTRASILNLCLQLNLRR